MHKETVNTILDLIKQIKNIDLVENATIAFPNEDLNNILTNYEFSITDVIHLVKRCMVQFEEIFHSQDGRFLPFKFNVKEINGSGGENTLIEMLQHMLTYGVMRDTQFLEIGHSLRWLITYQQMLGIWDRSQKKVHSVDALQLKEKQVEIDILKNKLENTIAESEKLNTELTNEKNRLVELYNQKNQDFEGLSNQSSVANAKSSEIQQYWEQATRQKTEIEGLIENLDKQVKIQKEEYADLRKEIDKNESNLKTTLSNARKDITEINESKETIEYRLEEAKRLLGLSADAALGGKFSIREQKVSKSLIWWRVAICVSVVLSVAWAVIVFMYLATKTSLPYLDILVNLVKTSPGFILMAYIMAQYNKERAIEEEYAFRAAIAETINAYADLLDNADSNDNVSRQAMLLDAIKQVYSKPQMHKENVKSNIYKESTKELLEVLKNIKLSS